MRIIAITAADGKITDTAVTTVSLADAFWQQDKQSWCGYYALTDAESKEID